MVSRIERLHVSNYRALRDFEIDGLRPFTALIGPNGSGKSTVFDVFAFLRDCFSDGVSTACETRGGIAHLRSKGAAESDALRFSLTYREDSDGYLMQYQVALAEEEGVPVVVHESLASTAEPDSEETRNFLIFRQGSGSLFDENSGGYIHPRLARSDVLAVNALGMLQDHPRVAALRRFISGWYLSYVSAQAGRALPPIGPQPRLSVSGDNLLNVLQYLSERQPARLDSIKSALRLSVPQLADIDFEKTSDGRLVLWLRDEPFQERFQGRFASDGTLKMLAYLTLLNDPDLPPFIGIEEPENHLYWSVLPGLADACRQASESSQILVSTHSHEFINECQPNEVLVLSRDATGYAKAQWAKDLDFVQDQVENGGQLGWLWQEGYLGGPEPKASMNINRQADDAA